MASAPNRRHIEAVREATRELRASLAVLTQLKRDWDGGFGTWIDDVTTEGGDFENMDGLEKADIAAVYSTVAAINALMAAGHDTNLLKVQ